MVWAVVCLILTFPLLVILELLLVYTLTVQVILVGLPIAAIVLACRAWQRATKSNIRDQWSATVIIILGVVVAGFVLSVANVGAGDFHFQSRARVKCASNLRQIGLALMMYSNANNGMLPATLEPIIADAEMSPAVFVCPSTLVDERTLKTTPQEMAKQYREQPHAVSYKYLGGNLVNPVPPDQSAKRDRYHDQQVIAYEQPHNHKDGGVNVLFGDGHVETIDKKHVAKMIAELAAGHNPPVRE